MGYYFIRDIGFLSFWIFFRFGIYIKVDIFSVCFFGWRDCSYFFFVFFGCIGIIFCYVFFVVVFVELRILLVIRGSRGMRGVE